VIVVVFLLANAAGPQRAGYMTGFIVIFVGAAGSLIQLAFGLIMFGERAFWLLLIGSIIIFFFVVLLINVCCVIHPAGGVL
jgi:hypothetical protein